MIQHVQSRNAVLRLFWN